MADAKSKDQKAPSCVAIKPKGWARAEIEKLFNMDTDEVVKTERTSKNGKDVTVTMSNRNVVITCKFSKGSYEVSHIRDLIVTFAVDGVEPVIQAEMLNKHVIKLGVKFLGYAEAIYAFDEPEV